MAPPIRQWPVCRKRWAGLIRAWTGRPASHNQFLSLSPGGAWQLGSTTVGTRLRLVHAWPSSAWITLRFQAEGPPAPGGPLEVTVWRSSLPDSDWRALRMSVERQIASRSPAPHKERP